MRDGRTALRCGGLALLAACGDPAPVELPAGRAQAVAVVDDRAIMMLTDYERRSWLASIDELGAARWVVPAPASLATYASEATRLVGAGAFGLVRRMDRSPSREVVLGFSTIDGAPRWQFAGVVEEDGSEPVMRWIDGEQLLEWYADQPTWEVERASGPTWRVEARDLASGALQFRRVWPREEDLAPLRFAEHVAVPEGSQWLLYRRRDGVLRARLPIDGAACGLGESIVGVVGEAIVAIDVARPEASPRVLVARLPEPVRAKQPSLASCHRRGDGVVLQLHDSRRSYVLALAADGSIVDWGRLITPTPLALAPEVGEVAPLIGERGQAERVLSLHGLQARFGESTERLQLEPAIYPASFGGLEPFPGGYLAWSWDTTAELVAIDALTGELTGAATVLGGLDPIGPQQLVDGRLWLFGSREDGSPLRLRALDLRSLRPLGPGGFEVVDRTAEARAAWLPSTQDVEIEDAADGVVPEVPCTSRPNAPFLLPPWDLAELRLAGAQATGGAIEPEALELLAWDSDSVDRVGSPGEPNEPGPRTALSETGHFASAVMVAHDLDADGPRWWLVPLRSMLGPWQAVDRVTPLRRRPGARDVAVAIARGEGDVLHVMAGRGGPFPDVADLDRGRFLALTGAVPGPERCVPRVDAGRAMSGGDGPTQRQRQQGRLAPQRPRR